MQQLLPLLCMLACPVGMGIMWWMARDKNAQSQNQAPDSLSSPAIDDRPIQSGNPDERLVLLKARLGLMQAQQTDLIERIEQFSKHDEAQSKESVPQEQKVKNV